MSDVVVDEFRRRVRSGVEPVWLPSLTAYLTAAVWRGLERQMGLTYATYGTARMISKNAEAERIDAFGIPVRTGGADTIVIPVEMLSQDIMRTCAPETAFLSLSSLSDVAVRESVLAAFDFIATVSGIASTIALLVRSVHLLSAESDDHDISFSLPELPFSIFVSVPGPRASSGLLRIAEAVLHEAMHLQLTLLESVEPLARSGERVYYSPWRQEHRTVQGVLHALYVFRVVQEFWRAAPVFARTDDRQFAARRVETIAGQLHEIEGFSECSGLTSFGRELAQWLMRECVIRAGG